MSNQTKHILVCRLSAMGDVAMTIPVLRAFTERYPDIKITVLTKPFFKPFFRDLKQVAVFSADVKGAHKGVYGIYKIARELNKNRGFDAVADLHGVLRTKMLKTFIKTGHWISIDKGRSLKKDLISGAIFEPLKTTHQRYVDVFNALGYPLDLSDPTFPRKAVLSKKILALIGEDHREIVGVAPFAAHQGKRYPLDLMKQVIEKLSKDFRVVLFGGGETEVARLMAIENTFQNVVSVAGKLTLDEELDVISNLKVLLSMDSGNAHLAAMLGVKVVTVWGVTHPYAGFSPFNQPQDYALLPDRNMFPKIPTSIYGNKYPKGYEKAAGSISPSVVADRVKAVC